jgi:AcrR family transcriptional regulator
VTAKPVPPLSTLDTRDVILDAAERLFAASGLNGTSMREIATAANVAQALIHYHFGTKENLYREMFTRRSSEINDERSHRLEELFANGTPSLEEVLHVLLRPTVELGRDPRRGGSFFSRLLVSVAAGDDPLSKDLVSKCYDPTARLFIKAFRRVLPNLSQEDAVWGYLFVIGVGTTLMARTGRVNRLSNGLCNDESIEQMMQRIVPFAAAGLRALEHNKSTPQSSSHLSTRPPARSRKPKASKKTLGAKPT